MIPNNAPTLKLNLETKDCFICGPQNAVGLHIQFFPDGPHGTRAEYVAQKEHCGWPGLLHGGVTFALMDEAFAYALYMQGLYGVTAKVETRFRQPVRVGEKLLIRAWTMEQRRRLVDARAEIHLGSESGPVIAEAAATMYLQEPVEKQSPANPR
jgi:uncharacterized protein (TIGR00369 family)